MKIVIDIDKESYEHIKANKNEDVLPMGWYAISHGTPLTSDVPDINVGSRKRGNMTFKIIDNNTGKEPTSSAIDNIAIEGGLVRNDIEQFYVGEDGTLILVDDCGNITYCDSTRFKVMTESEDCISRAAVLDQLDQAYNLLDAEHRIKALRPIKPKERE